MDYLDAKTTNNTCVALIGTPQIESYKTLEQELTMNSDRDSDRDSSRDLDPLKQEMKQVSVNLFFFKKI